MPTTQPCDQLAHLSKRKSPPVNFFRILVILLIVIGLIPPVIIDLLDARNILNGNFLAICGLLFAGGIILTERQSPFCVFEKGLAASGIALSLSVGFINYYQGTFYPEGYKFILLFLVIFVGKELTRLLPVENIVSDYSLILGIFVIAVFGASALISQDNILKEVGPGGMYERLDVTGSVTTLAIFATIFLLTAPAILSSCRNLPIKALHLLAVCAALYLLLFSASRQSILIILSYLLILFLAGNERLTRFYRTKILTLLFVGTIIFSLFTIFINNSFYIRMFENPSEDYSSGRLNSIYLWLEEMEQNGSPLGFGYIHTHTIPEIELLWPHNEFARFYFEGGVIGVGILLLLFVYTFVVLRIVLHNQLPQAVRLVVTVIVSVMFVQLMLENMFHHIYRTTFWFLLLSLSAHYALDRRQTALAHAEADQGQ